MMIVKAVLCRGGVCVSERPCLAARGVGIGQAADRRRVRCAARHDANSLAFRHHYIELALKAYLAKFGATPKQLRQLDRRHNLNKLVTEAVEKGLHLTPETQDGIRALAEAHAKFWHRYPRDDGKVEVLVIEQFIGAAYEPLNAVSVEVRGAPLDTLIDDADAKT